MTSAKDTKTLPKVEADDFDLLRNCIPLPNGWEIQTKGKRSTFRLCKVEADGTTTRWLVQDENLHQPLEQIAADLRAHVEQLEREVNTLREQLAAKQLALSKRLQMAVQQRSTALSSPELLTEANQRRVAFFARRGFVAIDLTDEVLKQRVFAAADKMRDCEIGHESVENLMRFVREVVRVQDIPEPPTLGRQGSEEEVERFLEEHSFLRKIKEDKKP